MLSSFGQTLWKRPLGLLGLDGVRHARTHARTHAHTHIETHTHTHAQKRGHARTAASKCRATAPRRRAVPAGSCCSHLSRLRTGPFDETTRSAAAEAAAV